MKQRLLFLLFLNLPGLCVAQVTTDSLRGPNISQAKFSYLNENVSVLPESHLPAYMKLDSIRTEFSTTADSLQDKYHRSITDINARVTKLNNKIDSLEKLRMRSGKYRKSLNRLSEQRTETEVQFLEKLASLKSATTEKLNALDLPPEYKDPLQNLTSRIDNVALNSNIHLPELKIPGYDIPDLAGNAPSLEGLANSTTIPELPDMQAPGEISDVTQNIQGYSDDINKISKGDIASVQKLPETIESQAARIEGIEELQNQSGIIDGHKAKLEELTDAKTGKQKAAGVAKKAAVDHFAGKQEQLKAAMDKISKYKQKYSSVSSIKDLPKRPPNPMKVKPFIERLAPGVYLQYQRKNFYFLDVNPYVGYKLTGRLSTGLGWNHRFAWDDKTHAFSSRTRIFGPRTYIDFKLGKAFIAHIEGETMNTFVPSTLFGNPDTGEREWVWSFMTGIKKEYRIYKNLKGTALIQYNLFNRYYKAPYVDRLNSRIGFEYVLKKAKKNKTKAVS